MKLFSGKVLIFVTFFIIKSGIFNSGFILIGEENSQVKSIKRTLSLKKFSNELSGKVDYNDEELLNSEHFTKDFIKSYKKHLRPRIQQLWKFIPDSSKVYVDLDGDNVNEAIVWSEGLNNTTLASRDFIAVFKQEAKNWEISQFKLISPTVQIHLDGDAGFAFSKKQVVDIHNNGTKEVLLQYTAIGGNSSTSYLELVSSRGIEQLTSLQPVSFKGDTFVTVSHKRGEFDSLISQRLAGYIETALKWSEKKGFMELSQTTVKHKTLLSVPDYEAFYEASNRQINPQIPIKEILKKLELIELDAGNIDFCIDYNKEVTKEISILLSAVKTSKIEKLFWECHSNSLANSELSQGPQQRMTPYAETMACIMYELSKRKTEEAVKTLIKLYCNPKITYDAGHSLTAMDAIVKCGKMALPNLRTKDIELRHISKLIDLIENEAQSAF